MRRSDIHRNKYITIFLTVFLYAINTETYRAEPRGFREADLKWQDECLRKGKYTRSDRSEKIGRLGLIIRIPAGMDFDFYSANERSSITVSEIEGLVLRQCNNMAARLHNISLPGRGFSTISLEAGERHPKPGQDEFLDAAIIAGKKRPIYTDGIEIWTSFSNPVNHKNIVMTGYEVSPAFFVEFASSIRPD